jgi:two-component system, cell cycle response regulator
MKISPKFASRLDAHVSAPTSAKIKATMLLSDDFLVALYRDKFHIENFQFEWTTDPAHFETSIQKQTPDLVLIDLALFPENPIEFVHAVKRRLPKTEIIVLSHTDDVHIAIAAFKAGVTDYYLKPTNPETLLWTFQKLMRQKSILPLDPTLQADLKMFGVTHHVSLAETDSKMRELAMQYLIEALEAKGGVWLWPLHAKAKRPKKPLRTLKNEPYAIESFSCSMELGLAEFREFQQKFPHLIEDSFETHLTSHPEHWFRENYTWIPLQNANMGGLLVFGVKANINTALQARTEFLIRSLEVSLENHRRYVEAKQLTYVDDVTGLYNPRYLDVALSAAIDNMNTHAQAKDKGFCILFIDIDKFKLINDEHGHLVGSQMLVHIAKMLKQGLRKGDQVFRYGGDEFIALLHGVPISEAKEIAERIRIATERRIFRFPECDVKVTLSIGISRFPDHGTDKKTIIGMADHAMYESKRNGRNQVFLATPKP